MNDNRIATPAAVLDFWRAAGAERWFTADAAFDRDCAERFLATWQAAARGDLATWETTDDGALALIVVLDQFPRNMFRGDGQAFASDATARDVASRAIARGVDRRIDPALRSFVYMPLMHSEHVADQERCVTLFARADDADGLKYANIHADIIRRFGRFPHRNRALGRITTAEEQAYLNAGGFAG